MTATRTPHDIAARQHVAAHYDVAVVGAGPAGCAAAAGFSREGASVLLLEANPKAASRLAGEWLHPPGLRVLDKLDLIPWSDVAQHPACTGFVVFPDDGSEPVRLPYVGGEASSRRDRPSSDRPSSDRPSPDRLAGVGLCCDHDVFVQHLREKVRERRGVTYLPHHRVRRVDGHNVQFCGPGRQEHDVRVGQVVGADGRSSIVRQSAGAPDESILVSYMAGVEIHDAELPFEGFGHVLLGGPGPMMVYRIGPNRIRACIDLPSDYPGAQRDSRYLWDAFSPCMPRSLKRAYRTALEQGRLQWAANRFRPRTWYGAGNVALVGDAVGYFHPLTAAGITVGIRDADCLVQSPSVEAYQEKRESESYVPELLTNALYQVFVREDAGASAIRRSVYEAWRKSPPERARTMRILAGDEVRPAQFRSAFVRMAASAAREIASSDARRGDWLSLAKNLTGFSEWVQWPAATILPKSFRRTLRRHSTPVNPLYALGVRPSGRVESIPPARPFNSPGPKTAEPKTAGPSSAGPSSVGPSSVGPSQGPIQGQRGGAAARSAGRERSDVLGSSPHGNEAMDHHVSRPKNQQTGLERPSEPLDGERAALDAERIATVEQQLEEQRVDGSFGDIAATRAAVGLLSHVHQVHPGLLGGAIPTALKRAAQCLLGLQKPDGSFGRSADGADRVVADTARAIEALVDCSIEAFDPAVRRGNRWLVSAQHADGSFGSRETTGRAVHALLYARAPQWDAINRGVQTLLAHPEDDGVAIAQQALSLYELRSERRVTPSRRRESARRSAASGDGSVPRGGEPRGGEPLGSEPRGGEPPGSEPRGGEPLGSERSGGAPSDGEAPSGALSHDKSPQSESDWDFCKRSLLAVSRTFVRPIEMLPGKLEVAVTCGYLLCRIADTVEDAPNLNAAERDERFAAFLNALERGASPETFSAQFDEVEGSAAEIELAQNLAAVLRVFRTLPEDMRVKTTQWVCEMTRGMSLYGRRAPGADGITALHTMEDLQRYCYFVAGTVGQMLTDLFIAEMTELDANRQRVLREQAEAFGLGLQLVNILKDVTDDRERSWSFVPRTLCAAENLTLPQLTLPEHRERAHDVVAPIFDLAQSYLDRALVYTLAIPAERTAVRLFCLLPLWMAVRTLMLARNNDAMFVSDCPVKIARTEVEALIADCVANAGDDRALKRMYRTLWQRPTELTETASTVTH